MNKYFDRLVFVSISVLLMTVSCGWSCDDCENEKSETRSEYGFPEEINQYHTAEYHHENWWYWSQGYRRAFNWGSDVPECCETFEYTFDPISGPALDTLNNITAAEAFAKGMMAHWAQTSGSFSLMLDGVLHAPLSSNVYFDYVQCREDIKNFSQLNEAKQNRTVFLLAEAALRLSQLEE